MLIFILLVPFFLIYTQEYKNWSKHSYIRFFEKKKIIVPSGSLDNFGNTIYSGEIIYFSPTYISDGIYEIAVGNKISSELYEISGSNIYMQFSIPPVLLYYQKGILEV